MNSLSCAMFASVGALWSVSVLGIARALTRRSSGLRKQLRSPLNSTLGLAILIARQKAGNCYLSAS